MKQTLIKYIESLSEEEHLLIERIGKRIGKLNTSIASGAIVESNFNKINQKYFDEKTLRRFNHWELGLIDKVEKLKEVEIDWESLIKEIKSENLLAKKASGSILSFFLLKIYFKYYLGINYAEKNRDLIRKCYIVSCFLSIAD